MKKFVLALAVTLAAMPLFAQQKMETLAGNSKVRVGGYGAPSIKFTTLDDKFAVMLGGMAGVMLNSKVTLGLAGYGLANKIETPKLNDTDPTEYWSMWYSGAVVDYTFSSNKLFHWSVGALIGGGGIMKGNRFDDWDEWEGDRWHDASGFFVAEPQISAEMNITNYLRIGIGASYRLVRGSDTPGITDNKLSGPAAHFTIKAGKF
ncbi:hypothetical protein COR50_20920 [Chitinophaga caeni]|uniref:Outer membrane protein beta-barrel domain-containing protein n=1 Tax=Chitinophaga caeni TaxID=2029983 RepID=A0A291QZI6_9BACT|nr:hypothetical protein [Chitinophaga caeni]ATL49439.1 hypothetical protein COR50_20920 [Chitinophaga caeni]